MATIEWSFGPLIVLMIRVSGFDLESGFLAILAVLPCNLNFHALFCAMSYNVYLRNTSVSDPPIKRFIN